MYDFIYDIPTRVYFGENQLEHLGEELSRYGRKVLLVYGGGSIKKIGLYDKVLEEIGKAGLEVLELSGVKPNPEVGLIREGVKLCKDENVDVILAVGGGSALDSAKFIGVGACVDHDVWDFVSSKWAPMEKTLPVITILTLAATGSEMDRGAVMSNPETQEKIGRNDNMMFPKASFLVPSNTYTVSPYQTACGSADILSHIMETYFDPNGNLYMIDCFMEGLMKTVIKYAPIAMKEPDNYEARANLMWCSSWAINGFARCAQTCVWSNHPMEHELSALYDMTHGLGLAILTPRWMEYVLDETSVDRFAQFGVNVFGIDAGLAPMEIAKKAIAALAKFFYEDLGLTSNLTDAGAKKEDIPFMAKRACKGAKINGYRPLYQEDIEKIYEACF